MNSTVFRAVRVLDLGAADGMTVPCDLRVRDGRIAQVARALAPEPGEEIVEGRNSMLMPGLVTDISIRP